MSHGRKGRRRDIGKSKKAILPSLVELELEPSNLFLSVGEINIYFFLSEPIAMVGNLGAEGGDSAETERALAERLHKLTTLENKEVMSEKGKMSFRPRRDREIS